VSATGVYDCEYRLRGADGGYRWIEARAVPLPDDGPRPRYFGVGHDISERKAAAEATRRRSQLDSMAASVSTRLAGATLETVPLAVEFALRETGRHLDADRASLYVLAPDRVQIQSARVWRREDDTVVDDPTVSDIARLDWLRARALGLDQVLVSSADTLPQDASAERETLAALGLESVLVVPMVQEGALIGALTYGVLAGGADDGTGAERENQSWTQEDVSLVRMVADQLVRLLVWGWDELDLRAIGYPAGLHGDEIGEFARVIAVADVVEAMSSDRPYRPAIGSEPALTEIEAGSGVRYDERVASACLRLFREQGFVLRDEELPER